MRKMANQASRIARRFGGLPAFHAALVKRDHTIAFSTVWRWTNKPGGIVPRDRVAQVREAARLEGIQLTMEDWLPWDDDEDLGNDDFLSVA